MQLELVQNEKYKVRKTEYKGDVWFVARDVADILGYKNPHAAILSHIDDDDRITIKVETSKGKRNSLFINEIGVYSLILGSTLDAAKEFKRWICGDVIPSIRKTGAYMTDETLAKVNGNPEAMAELTATLQAERNAHAETKKLLGSCEDMLKRQNEAISNLNETVKVKDELISRKNAYFVRNKPKIDFAKAVYDNKTAILIGEMAKLLAQNGIEIGQNRFFEWLRENGYLQRKEGNMHNVPYQKCIEQGLFIIKENTITNNKGDEIISRTPMVTGKGQRYFIAKFLQTKDEEALAAMSEEDLKLQADENRIIAEAQAMAKADEDAQTSYSTEASTRDLDDLNVELQKTKAVIAENHVTMQVSKDIREQITQELAAIREDNAVDEDDEIEPLDNIDGNPSDGNTSIDELEPLYNNTEDTVDELEPIE